MKTRQTLLLTLLCVLLAGGLFAAPADASNKNVGRLDYETPAYLAFNLNQYTVSEDETDATVTVIRTGEHRQPTSVEFSTRDGSAIAGADYTATRGELVFPAGHSVATFSIPIGPDRTRRVDKSFEVYLFNPAPNGLITQETATVVLPANLSVVGSSNPTLTIRVNSRHALVLSWATTPGRYALEKSDTLSDWSIVSTAPTEMDGEQTVVEPMTSSRCFYRLRTLP